MVKIHFSDVIRYNSVPRHDKGITISPQTKNDKKIVYSRTYPHISRTRKYLDGVLGNQYCYNNYLIINSKYGMCDVADVTQIAIKKVICTYIKLDQQKD